MINCQAWVDDYKKFVRLALTQLGLHATPKWHPCAHVGHQSLGIGAPVFVAVWREEQLNAKLKKVAGRAHRFVWHARILAEMKRADF